MGEEAQAHLRDLARVPDFRAVCSSAGWTDRSHVLYLSLLQASFVSQLHGGETSFKQGGDLSSSKAGRAKSCRKKAERLGPPSCSEDDQEDDGEAHSISTDDDASTSTAGTAGRSGSSRASAGRSSACRSGKRERSPSRAAGSCERTTRSRVASEGSGQNFSGGDVGGYARGWRIEKTPRQQRASESGGETTDEQVTDRYEYDKTRWSRKFTF